MSGYDKKDAAHDTGSSIKEVSSAHHQAREDARSSGGLGSKSGGDNTPVDRSCMNELESQYGLNSGGGSK